jgi:glyoxylase-like metal-dependent hydrolase (beta-lactamase superfamily II)
MDAVGYPMDKIEYLALSHPHSDHAGNANAFSGATWLVHQGDYDMMFGPNVSSQSINPLHATLVMTRVQQQEMAELGQGIQETGAKRSPLHGELLKGVPYPTPDILFDREHRLDLGGVQVRLLWRGPAALHTRGDTMVWVEQDRVLFTGDVVMSQRFLAAQPTSSIRTWVTTLDELTALKPAHVVPSHGKTGDVQLIARDRAFLQAVQTRAAEMKRAGRTVDETIAAIVADIAPGYPEWGNPSGAAAIVRAAYAEAP